jgi:DNA mismatch endonuclease (patch repair protein)
MVRVQLNEPDTHHITPFQGQFGYAPLPINMPLNRSQQMSHIRGRDTSPEMVLRRAIWSTGHRYRVGVRTPFGRPDIVFPGKRVAIFVDGCEWHGCPEHYVRPRSNTAFWDFKLKENTQRDQRQTLSLEATGWRVLRFWEHDVYEKLEACVAEVTRALELSDEALPRLHFRVVRVEPLGDSGLERRYLTELRGVAGSCVEERMRSTKKWSRPRSTLQ